MVASADPRRTLPEVLASGLFATALGAGAVWGLPHIGADMLHQLEVRRWDVSQCEILGRRVVEYRGGLLPDVRHEEFTFQFDLREVGTGRRFKALRTPDPLTRLYPEEVPDYWIGDVPGTRTGCRIDPGAERAYLRAGSIGDVGLIIFGTAMVAMFALVGVVGVADAVRELARGRER